MRSINRITLCGVIGRDPEIRMSHSGIKVANCSVATNKRDKEGKETTQWHKCVGFAKTAEYIELHIKRGSKVLLEGEMQYGEYEREGVKTLTAKIVIGVIAAMQDMPKEDDDDYKPSTYSKPKPGPGPGSNYYSQSSGTDLEEELPF